MDFIITKINCFSGYNGQERVIFQDRGLIEVEFDVYMPSEQGNPDRNISVNINLENSYGLTLDEIKNNAIEMAKEKVKAVADQI